MRTFALLAALALVCACKNETPAGTTLVDWTYTPSTPADSVPTPLSPPQTVTESAEWPLAKGPPVQLKFETEIGEKLVGGTLWHEPRHVRITLAQATSAPLPKVDCMPEPPGNKLVGGNLVFPTGHDGTTPIGLVGCFFLSKEPETSVFDINGDGHVTRNVAKKSP